jgi:PhzF family phenazine biosynthesis protein
MEILEYAAFTTDPTGGNPAGVVLDATGLTELRMQEVAAEVGFSETAFVMGRTGDTLRVRYFSPLAEVAFCGHATIATAVALAERSGAEDIVFDTGAGPVAVSTEVDSETGAVAATLVSVPPRTADLTDAERRELLAVLRWTEEDLDPAFPVRNAYAGLWHPVVAADSRDRLARLDYDFKALEQLCVDREWTTIQLVWRESPTVFHSRNPFPIGGVVEDPATGAAAAALGGYLRDLALVDLPARITVHQGDDLGRPGLLTVSIPAEPGTGIAVAGNAVGLPG